MESLKALVSDKERCLDTLLAQATSTLADHRRFAAATDAVAAQAAAADRALSALGTRVAAAEGRSREAARDARAQAAAAQGQLHSVEAALQVRFTATDTSHGVIAVLCLIGARSWSSLLVDAVVRALR